MRLSFIISLLLLYLFLTKAQGKYYFQDTSLIRAFCYSNCVSHVTYFCEGIRLEKGSYAVKKHKQHVGHHYFQVLCIHVNFLIYKCHVNLHLYFNFLLMLIKKFTSGCRMKRVICWKEVIVMIRKPFSAKMKNAQVPWRKESLEYPENQTPSYPAFMKITVDLDIIDQATISFLDQKKKKSSFFVLPYNTSILQSLTNVTM